MIGVVFVIVPSASLASDEPDPARFGSLAREALWATGWHAKLRALRSPLVLRC
jgi:hypothetical protein